MRRLAGLATAACLAAATSAGAAVPPVNPTDYPQLTDQEIGHIRHMVRLSRQLPGDWADMGTDIWAVAERTLQFQLSYMAVAVGLVQHSYTPAYRELYQPTMDQLIQKMTLPDVWELWINSSRAGTFRSRSGDLQAGWTDPVRKYNIMLKGYLLQAGAMYDMLYQDGKYEKPDAFTFRHIPITWGNGPITFRYSLPDVAKIVYDEYVASDFRGVQCEPNVVFPECNQTPILGLINFDQAHGTHYANDIMPKFKANWEKIGYTDPATKQNIDYYRVSTQERVGKIGPTGDGWANSWMFTWDPEHVQAVYPALRQLYLENFLTGAYARNLPPYGNRDLISTGFGQYAFMAAEVGDAEARTKLIAYADRNFSATWQDGEYYYKRSYDYAPDAAGNSHGVDTWTGNVLIALARLDTGGAFQSLYRHPWTKADLTDPYIADVDYPTTSVSQAWYDRAKQALVVTIEPGPVKAKETSFSVRQLKAGTRYLVLRDGTAIGHVGDGALTPKADGSVSIPVTLDGRHSYVVVADV
ncbi:MAG TPA: hypothetical protein VKS60_10290 [Stellaceae bacterium]|nr:hypothetical protein [Stellaceae bacterium]